MIKLGPKPKGGHRPRVLSTKKNTAPIRRSGRSSQVDGESFDGASLVHFAKVSFCKQCHGGRIYSPSERGCRGGEGGMLGGGYGGAGGGGDGGEVLVEKWVLWW